MRFKVLHLAHGRVYGGIERVLVAFASERLHAPEMQAEFTVCFDGRMTDELKIGGATVHSLGGARLSRPWSVIRARESLRRNIDASRPDVVVVHGNWSHGLFGGVIQRERVQLVAFAHAPYGDGGWTERLASRYVPKLILANSRFTAASTSRVFPTARTAVNHYPVSNVKSEASPERNRPAIRARLETAIDSTVVLMACRLDPYKGHEVLIRSAAELRHDDIHIWIAGGPQSPADVKRFADLKNLAVSCGVERRVHFLGQRDDVAELMSAADIFCQPNVGPEAFGVVFIEALSAGLPVITSAVGGGAEIVDSSCGRLTSAGDVTAVAAAIQELAADPALRISLGAAGVVRARTLCDPSAQMPELAKLLEDAVQNKNKSTIASLV